MANFFSVLFVVATIAVIGMHSVTCQVVTAAAMCPCLVPISAPADAVAVAGPSAASAGMSESPKREYKHVSLPNGKSSFEVSGIAYAPEGGAQALRITENGLEASQATARRQNMNAQSNVSQESQRRQNMNAQSNVSQQSARRQNMNAQSQVSQSS